MVRRKSSLNELVLTPEYMVHFLTYFFLLPLYHVFVHVSIFYRKIINILRVFINFSQFSLIYIPSKRKLSLWRNKTPTKQYNSTASPIRNSRKKSSQCHYVAFCFFPWRSRYIMAAFYLYQSSWLSTVSSEVSHGTQTSGSRKYNFIVLVWYVKFLFFYCSYIQQTN